MLHSKRDSITVQLQHFLERVLHIDALLRRNKSKVLTQKTSREYQYIEKNECIIPTHYFTEFIESLLPQVIKMKKIFTLCLHVTL